MSLARKISIIFRREKIQKFGENANVIDPVTLSCRARKLWLMLLLPMDTYVVTDVLGFSGGGRTQTGTILLTEGNKTHCIVCNGTPTSPHACPRCESTFNVCDTCRDAPCPCRARSSLHEWDGFVWTWRTTIQCQDHRIDTCAASCAACQAWRCRHDLFDAKCQACQTPLLWCVNCPDNIAHDTVCSECFLKKGAVRPSLEAIPLAVRNVQMQEHIHKEKSSIINRCKTMETAQN